MPIATATGKGVLGLAGFTLAGISTTSTYLQAIGFGIGGIVGLATLVSIGFDIRRKYRDRNK